MCKTERILTRLNSRFVIFATVAIREPLRLVCEKYEAHRIRTRYMDNEKYGITKYLHFLIFISCICFLKFLIFNLIDRLKPLNKNKYWEVQDQQ